MPNKLTLDEVLNGIAQKYSITPSQYSDSNKDMIETEFGDIMERGDGKTYFDKFETPKQKQLNDIDEQLRLVDSTMNANRDKWNQEATKNTYSGSMGMFAQPIQMSKTPEERRQLEATRFQLERAKKALNTYTDKDQEEDERIGNGKSWYEELWGGVKNTSFEDVADIATLGFVSAGNSSKINAILDKASRGEALSDVERLAVESYKQTQSAKNHVEERGGGTIFHSIGESLPTTAEFMFGTLATGGSLGITKSALKNGLWKAIGNVALREGLRTPMRGDMWSNFNERTASQYSFDGNGGIIKNETSAAERLWKGFATTYAEGLSEQFGNVVGSGAIGRGLKKVTPKLLGKKIGTVMVDGVGVLADKFKKPNEFLQKAFNWNGTFDEYLEEQVSMILDPLLTAEPERLKEIFNLKTQAITLGSVAAMGGTTHVLSYPSIAKDEIKSGNMRKGIKQSIFSISNDEIRQGVFDAVKQGRTIEEKVEMLSKVDWGNATAMDSANALDAFTGSVRYDIYKGFDESKQAEELASRQVVEYSDMFKQRANKDDGLVHLLSDESGNQYYLLAGSLDEQSADGMLFVRNAQTGLTEQVESSLLSFVEKKSYMDGLNEFMESLSNNVESEQQASQASEDKEDANDIGVKYGNYKEGQQVVLRDGRTAKYFADNGDRLSAQVKFYDSEIDEEITEDVSIDDIMGLAPEVDENVDARNNNADGQQSDVKPIVKQIPLQKDGTPDYDSMPAEMFFEEYSKVSSREEALQELQDEHTNIEDVIRKLEDKKTLSRNEKVQNRAKIAELRKKTTEIASVLSQNTQTNTEPRQSYAVGDNVRQRYADATKVYGNEKSIFTPNDEQIKGRYVLTESGVVTPSHNPKSFSQSDGFPVTESGSTVNDRDYGRDKEAQQQVISIAQKYNGRAIDNPVVVTPDGVVISGNNRTMSGELAAENGTDKAYLQHLAENAAQYGFTSEQIAGFKNPRIVFETTEPQSYNTETFAKFNAQETKTQNKVEKAIKIGKTIEPKTIRRISSIIDEHATLGELYGDPKSVSAVVKILQDSGIINQNEIAELKDGDGLSGTGKDMIETLLVGSVLSEDAVRLLNRNGMRKYRNRITKAILPVVENSTMGDYSIVEALSEAVTILDRARNQRGSVDDVTRQLDAFESIEYSPESVSIAKSLDGSGERDLRDLFAEYNRAAAAPSSGQRDLLTGSLQTKQEIMQAMGMVPIAPIEATTEQRKQFELSPEVEAEVQRLDKISPITMLDSPIELLNIYGDKLDEEGIAEIHLMNKSKGYLGGIDNISGNVYMFSDRITTPKKARRVWIHETIHAANAANFTQKELIRIFDRFGLDYFVNLVPKLYIDRYNEMMALGEGDFAKATLVDEAMAANEKYFAGEEVFDKFLDGTFDTSALNELGILAYNSIYNYIKDKENGVHLSNNNSTEDKTSRDIASTQSIGSGNVRSSTVSLLDDARRPGGGHESNPTDRNRNANPATVAREDKQSSKGAEIEQFKSTNNGLRTIKIGTGESNDNGLYDSLHPDDKQFDRGRDNAGTSIQNKDTTIGNLGAATELQQRVKPIRQSQTSTENSAAEIRKDGFPTINGVEQRDSSPSIGDDGIGEIINKNNTLQNARHVHDVISQTLGSSQVFQSSNERGVHGVLETSIQTIDNGGRREGRVRRLGRLHSPEVGEPAQRAGADAVRPTAGEDTRRTQEESNAATPFEGGINSQTKTTRVGENNTIVSADRIEELRKRAKEKLSQLNSGFDPELFAILTELSAGYIEAGVRKFADFTNNMVSEFGDKVKPYLASMYEGARRFPGMEQISKEMDSTIYVDNYIQELNENGTERTSRISNSVSTIVSNVDVGQQLGLFDTNVQSENAEGFSERESTGTVRTKKRISKRGNVEPTSIGDSNQSDVSDGVIGELRLEQQAEDRPTQADSQPHPILRRNGRNFRITDTSKSIVPNGEIAKIKANIAAIKLLRELQNANREATTEEQKTLSQYSGWGGLSTVLATNRLYDAAWTVKYGKYNAELKELLSKEEYTAAVNSTINAHYTTPQIISDIWGAVSRMGFKGGTVLEPAMGSGNFFGAMPSEISDNSRLIGYELDSITGAIAEKLYPDAKVKIAGYETASEGAASVDLVISNVPFGQNAPYDPKHKDIGKFSLHNYFIAKGLRQLRDGGIGVFITSSSTMDGGISRKFREWSEKDGNADFIGAIRLPNTAFATNAGTTVTTDILFYRKRDGITHSEHEQPYRNLATIRDVERKEQYNSKTRKYEDVTLPLQVNEYFASNPQMMLGDMYFAFEVGNGGLYSDTDQTLQAKKGDNLPESLIAALETLPQNIHGAGLGAVSTQIDAIDTDIISTFVVRDGKAYEVAESGLEPIVGTTKIGKNTYHNAEIVSSFVEVKQAAQRLVLSEQNSYDNAEIESQRKDLNVMYDAFTKKYGNFNRNNAISFLQDDIQHVITFALENIQEEDYLSPSGKTLKKYTVTKADILSKRISTPLELPTSANSAADAVQLSLRFKGSIDISYISSMLNVDEESAKAMILDGGDAFINPSTGKMEDRSEYLSGFVKDKLEIAREYAKTDSKFDSNIAELERAIPTDIAPSDVNFRMSSYWLPNEFVEAFFKDQFGLTARIKYVSELGEWVVNSNKYSQKNGMTAGLYDSELAEKVLNQRPVTVYRTVADKRVKDIEGTAEAAARMAEINDNFIEFVSNNDLYLSTVARIYNERFNTFVKRKYQSDGGYYPGANRDIKLRQHQSNAVQRMLSDSVLLAHEVGTGKTFTMITGAMEMRRLGIAKKPMIVVQNSTLEQFAASFQQLYPSAKLLVPSEKQRSAEKRQRLFAMIAYGDFDAVIIPQSFVDFIEDNPERIAEKLQGELDNITALAENTTDYTLQKELRKKTKSLEEEIEKISTPTVKDIAKKQLSVEKKLKRQSDRKTDKVFTFEELGVDALFVDEAHAYKKLGFTTSMGNVKGIDTGVSKRAFSMKMKTDWIQSRAGGRNVVFATGTPITNTMAEAWTMMRFISPDLLKRYGIENFDAFASTFGVVETGYEFNASGSFKQVERFKSFMNAPEFINIFKGKTDVVLSRDIPGFAEKLPKLLDNGFTQRIIRRSGELVDFMNIVKDELVAWSKMSKKERSPATPMVMFTRASQAAIDLRLIDPDAIDSDFSKANEVVRNVKRIYDKTSDYNGAQMIFSDKYQSPDYSASTSEFKVYRNPQSTGKRFNLYEDMKSKLIDMGVPASEIAIVTDMDAKKKEQLFARVNSGEVRVVFGSTEKMGVGVNAQRLLAAVHHVDAPSRPMDFTQRNGRIIRQGNLHSSMNLPVEVLTYGVEKTLDVTAYQRLATKQAFIDQVLSGDISSRIIDDEADEGSVTGQSFEEMMSNLSGSQYALRLTELNGKLRKAEMAVRSSERSRRDLKQRLNTNSQRVAPLKMEVMKLEKAIEASLALFPNDGKITKVSINDRVYTEKLSETIGNAMTTFGESYRKNRAVEPLRLTINDNPRKMVIMFDPNNDEFSYIMRIEDAEIKGEVGTGGGLMNSVPSKIKNLQKSFANSQAALRDVEESIPFLEKRLSEPNKNEDTVAELKAEIATVTKLMADESVAEEARIAAEQEVIGESDTDMRYRELQISRDGRKIDFRPVRHTSIFNGVCNYLKKTNIPYDMDWAKTGSKYIKFNKSDVEYNIRFANHTKGYYGESNDDDGLTIGFGDDNHIEDVDIDISLAPYKSADVIKLLSQVDMYNKSDIPTLLSDSKSIFDEYVKDEKLPSHDIEDKLSDYDLLASSLIRNADYEAGKAIDINRAQKIKELNYIDISEYTATNGVVIKTQNTKSPYEWKYDYSSIPNITGKNNREKRRRYLNNATNELCDKVGKPVSYNDFFNKLDSNIVYSIKEVEQQREYEQSKERRYTSPDKRKAHIVEQLQKLSKEFYTEVVVVDSVRELPDNLRHATKGKRFAGFYHKTTGKVYFVTSEIRDADDATASFLHEVVSHKGIDGLMGKENADKFYAAVFDSLDSKEQSRLIDKYGDKVIAGDEMVARMAEGDVIPSTMQRIIASVRRFFREVLGVPLTIKDNDIRYILWKSKNNLQQAKTVGDVMSVMQRDKAMQSKLYPKPKSLMGKIGDIAIRYRESSEPPRQVANAESFRVSGTKGTNKSNAIQVQEALQDSTIKVKLLQDEVKRRGGTIDMFTNPYEALNHRDSRADAAMQKYTNKYIKPFVEFIGTLSDVTYDDASDYMLAKHSLEREASGIKALDDNSGKWTKEHVKELISDFENKVSTEELTKLWSMWRASTNQILEIAVQSGRMSREEYNDILNREWHHYVPLRGKDFDFEGTKDMREVFHYDRTGRGSSGSNPSKDVVAIKALGRTSKAEDPISTLQNMAHLEIYLGEVNKSHIPLLRLAQKYSEMTELFQVKERWYVKLGEEWKPTDIKPSKSEIDTSVNARKAIRMYEQAIAKETNEDKILELREKIEQERGKITVTRRELETREYTGEPESIHNVTVMRDGVKYVVWLGDAEIAQAINNRSGSVQSWVSRYPGRVTRIMSQLATSKNPAFILPNFVRDLQHATLYNWVDSDGNTKDFLKYATVSWKTLHRNIRGSANPLTQSEIGALNIYNKTEREILVKKYGKARVNDTLYDLFVMNGGETGYVHILDPKEYQRKLRKEIATMTGDGAWNGTKRGWKAINNGIDYMANMSENAVRYATFMSQIDKGSNVFDAVTYAKNITVNFNRKGKYSKGIGALFMFFNAGVQGAQNTYSLWGNKKGKSNEEITKQRGKFIFANAVLATIGFASAALMYNMLQGLVGDDDEEFQISDYERRTNLIVPMPGADKGYIKMPIPIMFRPFYSLGVMAYDWVNGKIDAEDVMTASFGNIFDAVLPLQVSYDMDKDNIISSVAKSMIPSAIKPMTDILAYNHDFAGRKINRESPYNPNTPDSELGQANANKIAVAVSKWLNKLGGGNELTPAGIDEHGQKNVLNWMDISPSTIEHLVTQYTGGIGKMINETIVTFTADSKEVRKIPIANRFIGEAYEKDPSKEYYDIKRNVEWVDRGIRQSEEKGVENTLFSTEELPEKKRYYKEQRTKLKQTERRINNIKKQLENTQFGSYEYESYESQIDNLQRQFIKEYTDDKRN